MAGDAGAPLEDHEKEIIDRALPVVKKFMTGEGVASVEKNGAYQLDTDGELVTMLVENKHCAFVYFDRGIAKCSFEKANKEGLIDFKKPISCHLYPIRITRYKDFEAVNYHTWDICKPAINCGNKLDVPVYKFLKESLVRKYGEAWYQELSEVAAHFPL